MKKFKLHKEKKKSKLKKVIPIVALVAAAIGVGVVTSGSGGGAVACDALHYKVTGSETYSQIAAKCGLNVTELVKANRTGSASNQVPGTNSSPGDGRIIHLSPVTVPATTTTTIAPTTTQAPTTTTASTTTTTSTTTSLPSGTMFVENFASATALTDRFDHGWAGDWDNGALFGDARNDWLADHAMDSSGVCGDPNTTHRTIHLTDQQQANDAAFFPCTFSGDAAKSHMMTSVNTSGYITVWFAPKQTFTNVHRICWDQNINWQGGGKWTIVNFLTSAEYSGQTDLGYTSPDFPANGGPSSPQGSAMNGVKFFGGGLESYTNGNFNGSISGVGHPDFSPYYDHAPRFQFCVVDNDNGTLTLSMAQPDGSVVRGNVSGNIPDGTIKVEFADDNYNPDKHCGFNEVVCPNHDANGAVAENGIAGGYTWHWDNILVS